jgi:BirA family biotin operon repressor/biotin-[acetyl-CoA-carboxylase] ligase
LLLSLGFRPSYLAPDRLWRLGASVALAMADAAEDLCSLRAGTIRLKWPNDLVVEEAGEDGTEGVLRKLAGVLGETAGAGTTDPRAVIGIGINADWPRAEFPVELADAMTSLREVSGGRPVDRDALLEEFLARLEVRVLALRGGAFDVAAWHERQITTGRQVSLEGTGGTVRQALAVGVDGASGALLVQDAEGGEREILAGEIVHVRLARPRAERGGVTR